MFGKRKPSGEKPAAPRQEQGAGQREPRLQETKTPEKPGRAASPARPGAQPAARPAPPIANPSVNNPIAGITAPSRGTGTNGQTGNGNGSPGYGSGSQGSSTSKSSEHKATQGTEETPRRTQERREVKSMAGETEGKKLIVGREIRLAGEITTCDTLVVEGQVECNLSDSKMLDIAESGVFKGKANVEVAEISGLFEGELTVSQHLRLQGSGQIKGKLRYREMEIARGGRLSGDIAEMESGQSQSRSPAVESRPQPAEPEHKVVPDRDEDAPPRAAAGGSGAT